MKKRCKHTYTILELLSKDKKIQLYCLKCKSLWKMDVVPTKYYAYHKIKKCRNYNKGGGYKMPQM